MKSRLRALSLGAAVLSASALLAPSAEARILIDALGGEVKLEGALSSEARARVGSGDAYLNQWIQRFELNAEVNYQDKGVFDTLSFVTVIRPEFDAAYYYGDSIGGGTSRNNGEPSYLGDTAGYDNAPIEIGGFDIYQAGNNGLNTNRTGGLGKIVLNGFENPSWIQNNFEAILVRANNGGKYGPNNRSEAFPLTSITSQLPVSTIRARDQDNDPLDVAMNNTDSSGRLYPFRELYMDATAGDWWFRVGKQQVVWGKTDFFRLQDIVNPVDFGQHFFFDSYEDIRIPQWIATAQWKFGNVGPTTDNALTFLWNFDEFQPVGLGNPSAGWGHPFAKDTSVFNMYATYFAVEPCVSAAMEQADVLQDQANGFAGRTFNVDHVCGSRGPNDPRSAAGFGSPAGLRIDDRPEWDIENTEPGLRWEFRLGELHIAASYFYGWNDIPVFQFEIIIVLATGAAGFQPLGTNQARLGINDCTISDLLGGSPTHPFNGFEGPLDPTGACGDHGGAAGDGPLGFPINVMEPYAALQAIADGNSPDLASNRGPGEETLTISQAAKNAIAAKDATLFYNHSANALTGGFVKMAYKQSHTPGLSFDYFEPWSGIVFRVESSWTFDQIVTDTMKPDWLGTSDVMNWSIGLDRPTFIKWLNKDRTFFLSMQIFDTWYIDHEGTDHTGFLTDEHNFITTFFFIGNYMRDKVKPIGFVVWEEASQSYVAGFSTEWFIDNHWSVKGGFNTIWGGNANYTHDAGPYNAYIVPFVQNGITGRHGFNEGPLGVAHEGIGALRDNDEIFFQLKYQF